jgi:hypothetical protein
MTLQMNEMHQAQISNIDLHVKIEELRSQVYEKLTSQSSFPSVMQEQIRMDVTKSVIPEVEAFMMKALNKVDRDFNNI